MITLTRKFFVNYFCGQSISDNEIDSLVRKCLFISEKPLYETLHSIGKVFDPELFMTGNCGLLAFTLSLLYPGKNNSFIIAIEKEQYDSSFNKDFFYRNSEIMELSLSCGFFHIFFSDGSCVYDINGCFVSEKKSLDMLRKDNNDVDVNIVTFHPNQYQSLISTMFALTSGTMPNICIQDVIKETYKYMNYPLYRLSL